VITVLFVVGARPNFVKTAPVLHALDDGRVAVRVLNTGQHYDHALAGSFLELLRLPAPDFELGVGSGSHAEQTAAVLSGTERVLHDLRPDLVVVPGDVNSTFAAALAAVKLQIPVAHIEAGLRSRDRTMPEEINRILTDQIAELLLCTSADAVENLRAEGIDPERIALVGNTMIDSLLSLERAAAERETRERLELEGDYVLVTLHRPSLVDHPARLHDVMVVLEEVADRMPVVLPLHPRTAIQFDGRHPKVRAIPPLDYLDFLSLQRDARVVVTDSGGVQEEASVLGVPCLTYRNTTERPITIDAGTNRLVGTDPSALRDALAEVLREPRQRQRPSIPLWDGAAGGRAADAIRGYLGIV
jgi:UDP-N-acetylglucosamine 2-epimerase (non-hydrolysing)